MQLATKTLKAIDAALEIDGGAKYRGQLLSALKEMEESDAFSCEEEKHPRKHLGISQIGKKCALALWLQWRWAVWKKPEARMLRLLNRGHLEEARWVALFRTAGIHVQVKSEHGKQLRAYGYLGHFGGSIDGIGFGCPDAPGEWFLLEFKTANTKKFDKLSKDGVQIVYEEYYVQMQQYMAKLGLRLAMFCSVCKEDDRIHIEIVEASAHNSAHFDDRAKMLVEAKKPPPRISTTAVSFDCKFCDSREYCHGNARALPTCRTCAHVVVGHEGKWLCQGKYELTPEQQFAGCIHRVPMEGVK